MSKNGFLISIILLIVFVVVFFAWFLTPCLIPSIFSSHLPKEYDPFAILHSLFTGLAFAGVIGALLLQRRSLQIQREDFTQQINLLKDQTRQAEQSSVNSLLVPLLLEYRSQQMHEAISALWEFKHSHKEKFLDVYEERVKENNSIHFHRRLVSQFYGIVAGLYVTNSFPKEIIYSYWSKKDLQILPEIILPIENKLQAILPSSRQASFAAKDPVFILWEEKLKKLYLDAP